MGRHHKPRVPCVPSHFFLFRLYYTKPIIQDIFRSISVRSPYVPTVHRQWPKTKTKQMFTTKSEEEKDELPQLHNDKGEEIQKKNKTNNKMFRRSHTHSHMHTCRDTEVYTDETILSHTMTRTTH